MRAVFDTAGFGPSTESVSFRCLYSSCCDAGSIITKCKWASQLNLPCSCVNLPWFYKSGAKRGASGVTLRCQEMLPENERWGHGRLMGLPLQYLARVFSSSFVQVGILFRASNKP